MGCRPSNQKIGIIQVMPPKSHSNRPTGSKDPEEKVPLAVFQQINASLFMICEEGSKLEDSRFPSGNGMPIVPCHSSKDERTGQKGEPEENIAELLPGFLKSCAYNFLYSFGCTYGALWTVKFVLKLMKSDLKVSLN